MILFLADLADLADLFSAGDWVVESLIVVCVGGVIRHRQIAPYITTKAVGSVGERERER